MSRTEKWLKRAYLFVMFFFLYAPIAVLMVYSFNDSRLRGKWGGFTLRWYRELLQNEEILAALRTTLIIAVLATVVATILGTLAAVGIFHMKKRYRQSILNINYIPVLNPDIVTAVSLMVLYRSLSGLLEKFFHVSFEFGFTTMLLSHIAFTIPYVVLSVLPKLKQMNRFLPEAAMDLGATPWMAFRKVIFPEIKPGITTGALLAFTLSLDDFVISFFTTGHGYANLSTTIFGMAKRGINPVINALSTIMFLVMLGLLLIINFRTKEETE